MHRRRMYLLYGSILAFNLSAFIASPLACASEYAITAANVTMPSSGYGYGKFSVTGLFTAGTVTIGCQYSGPTTEARIPQYCGTMSLSPFQVTAGETLTGEISFVPYGDVPPPTPGDQHSAHHQPGHLSAVSLALAGVLLLGFGLRRKASRWLVLTVFAVSTLAGMTGISACAGNSSNGMTPGSYQYTVTASYANDLNNVIVPTSTTVYVTIP